MRIHLAALALTTFALSGMAQAANVAVADSQAAVLASNTAQQTITSLQASLKPQRDRLEQLTKDLKTLEDRFKKDGGVMSDKDKLALQSQAQSKLNDYNSTAEGMQRKVEEAQSNMLKTMMPKLEGVIEAIRKEGNYDVIIERKNVIWADPSVDITKKITDRLNAAK